MKNSATQAKQRWNSKHYTQVKVSVDPDVALAFKKTCVSSGVSMAKKLTEFMSEYSIVAAKSGRLPDFITIRQRRSAAKSMAKQLDILKTAEAQSRDRIPLNLQLSENYENADERVSLLEEAIELLKSIY
jgi:hypothetical protein